MSKKKSAALGAAALVLAGTPTPALADNTYGPFTADNIEPNGSARCYYNDLDCPSSIMLTETATAWVVEVKPELRFQRLDRADYDKHGEHTRHTSHRFNVTLRGIYERDAPGWEYGWYPHISASPPSEYSDGYALYLNSQPPTRENGFENDKDVSTCVSWEQDFGSPDTTGRDVTAFRTVFDKSCVDFPVDGMTAEHEEWSCWFGYTMCIDDSRTSTSTISWAPNHWGPKETPAPAQTPTPTPTSTAAPAPTLGKPTVKKAVYKRKSEKLRLRWKPVAGAQGYVLKVRARNHSGGRKWSAFETTRPKATLKFKRKSPRKIRMRAFNNQARSPWAVARVTRD